MAYRLPSRVLVGVVLWPHERVQIEPMEGWVGWKVVSDSDIDAAFSPKSVPDAPNPEESANRLEQHRLWARSSQDTVWAGVDGKWQSTEKVELDLRALYDHPAIPLSAISGNNYDTHTLTLIAGTRVGPFGPVRLGASVQQRIMAPRIVEDSIFAVTLDEERNPVRTYYPSAAGEYRGSITRFGLGLAFSM